MSERKNLKLSPESYQLLKQHKRRYETWDGMIHRIFDDNMETDEQ
jgi:hypothetical protein